MPQKWTDEVRNLYLLLLRRLYVAENKSLGEISALLGWPEQTVYSRLKKVGIVLTPERKAGYLVTTERTDISTPVRKTADLAEFFGIMLGDGHLSQYQITVTLGTKEMAYAEYAVSLMENLFGPRPKIAVCGDGHKTVYIGSTGLSRWLQKNGLVFNKVRAQVGVPPWIFKNKNFMERFLRGFFDTDGSWYKLRWGSQIAFTNKSLPLLSSTRDMLLSLGYSASRAVGYKVYLTKKEDVSRFFKEIRPKNPKHYVRFENFSRVGS